MSAKRINTGNFENGSDRLSTLSWKKYFDRHLSYESKSELTRMFKHDFDALQEIEKRFSPVLIGQHVYIKPENGGEQVCIGYVDEQSERGWYMIELDSQFGTDCEPMKGKKDAVSRLYQLYKEAIVQ
jgi:hypothetical protein